MAFSKSSLPPALSGADLKGKLRLWLMRLETADGVRPLQRRSGKVGRNGLPITLSPALPLKSHFFDLRRPTAAQCPTGWILSVGCGPKAKTVSNWSRDTYTHTWKHYSVQVRTFNSARLVPTYGNRDYDQTDRKFPADGSRGSFQLRMETPRPVSRDKLLMYSPILLDAQPSSCHLLGN